jgi:hypothetical protein
MAQQQSLMVRLFRWVRTFLIVHSVNGIQLHYVIGGHGDL